MKQFSILFFVVLLSSCAGSREPSFFELGTTRPATDTSTELESSTDVRIDAGLLIPGEPVSIILPLPGDKATVTLEPLDEKNLNLPGEQHAWSGHSKEGHEVFVMRIGKGFEARIQKDDNIFRLRSNDGVTGILEYYKGSKFREAPNDGIIDPSVTGEDMGTSGDSSCEDPANRIDIMVLYTPAARDGAGSVADIENEIAFAVGYTNLAYANSSVTHRLNLIYTGLVSYTEAAGGVDSNALLGDLADTSDGVLDSVHGLRDGAKADLVSLIYEVDDGGWCGWGQTQQTANADTTDHRAFSVVKRSCTGTNLSFAHEVGHNLGALHDRDNASASTLDFNFGHIQPVPNLATTNPWRSVMSYNSPCSDSSATGSCPRVPWFSNPDVTRLGDVTGVPLTDTEPEHNVMVMAQNDGEVSRYRCLRDGGDANVWMKDRWEDEGGEPDANTAGKSMWKSPYIWIRQTEDAALEHEHEHEDPQQGQTNHVYVKLHNTGGSSESSDLELYFADASTNLNNPSNWTMIDSHALTMSSGVSVEHFEWSGIPGSGHFCLLARWNIDGGALSFTDVGDAVRTDNDLIWRNVNVIPLAGGDSSADFEMAGDREENATYLLITTTPKSRIDLPWTEMATATVTLDPAVLDKGKLELHGVSEGAPGSYKFSLDDEVKLIGPVVLGPRDKTRARLDLSVDMAVVKQISAQLSNTAEFDITVAQIREAGVPLALEHASSLYSKPGLVIGGVSYTLQLPGNQ
jgi:hypothetical protein